ncbi:O-antigen ligase family protein [Bradyrhizobium sp. SSUT112]|uniref:O-antigen ligase family protein n=1 Tax=Bradyrhizobium sp. SSUT112 TaxID=3040604 RepID=UPI00244AFF35|nr:O-antigen ligase family protein [Bradyrhizobium sp. SSUT112]MDH2356826.1 O-antigen ligase family protein [Bradyrhizobium sp. SSUT112]
MSVILGVASFRLFTSRELFFLFCFAAVAVSWGFVINEQLTSPPIFAERVANPIWPQTATILGHELPSSASIARHQPYFAAGSQIACMLAMVTGFLVSRDRRAAHFLLRAFAASGLVYALYGIFSFCVWPDYVLWHAKVGYRNSLVGTFINPNVAAVYFGSCAMVWALMLAKALPVNSASRYPWRDTFDALFTRPSGTVVIGFTACFVVLSAMFMTGSRAGSIFSMLAITGALATLYRRELGLRGLLLTFPLYSAGTIVVALQIFGSRVEQRFDSEGLSDSGRWNTYLSTVNIIGDHPWLGSGLGTFRWVFPKYRSGEVPIAGIWDRAHSVTLEIASEMGIPFALLIIVGWLLLLIVMGRGILVRKRDEILPLAAFWISVLALLHSQIDFSLQIPGFAVPICAIVGMGLAQTSSSQSR